MKVKSEREVAHSCPTPSDPMDCSLCLPNLCQMREGLITVTYLEILLLCVEFDHCHISQWLYFKLA